MKPTGFQPLFAAFAVTLTLAGCNDRPAAPEDQESGSATPRHDFVILDGTVYDGLGGAPIIADIAVDGDRIAAIGELDATDGESVIEAMRTPSDEWENLYLAAGDPENLLFFAFKNESLKPLTGKTLAEVAEMRGTSPEQTMIDLVIEDDSRVDTVYFLMSEHNITHKIARPWMTFGSDAEASAPEGVFLKSATHPRAYGNFARLLGKYARDEQVIGLAEAIRRLNSAPVANLKLRDRGRIEPGFYADIVIVDPDTIQDHATDNDPMQLATGVRDVLVNGQIVLREGEHSGALPGRFVRGPGWKDQDS